MEKIKDGLPETDLKKQAEETKKFLFDKIKLHVGECLKEFDNLERIVSKEKDYEKITVFHHGGRTSSHSL